MLAEALAWIVGPARGNVGPMHLVPSGPVDSVVRRRQYEATHPEVSITIDGIMWKAYHGDQCLAQSSKLDWLIDDLESIDSSHH